MVFVVALSLGYWLLYLTFVKLMNGENLRIHSIPQSIILTVVFGTLGSFMRLVFEWIQGTIKQKELKIQNFNSELRLLKYQLNPHFLFNSLNNIDALIHEDPAKASKALNKLSEIMRYVVYKNENAKVPLSEELEYIENYLSLQRLRTVNESAINYKAEGKELDVMIAPMLFIPFIENAFKHASLKQENSEIDIFFKIMSQNIEFKCRNSFSDSIKKDKTSGIGLELIKKRLELLYPGKYQLTITSCDNIFEVTLNIDRHED
jgi:two-component system, LytTR family, sensor kinase